VPKAGDFIKLDLLGEPLVLVRGKDEVVRVLSRVCAHRGADIMPPGYTYEGQRPCAEAEGPAGCGHARFFMCPYHFWSFDLEGQLKAAPEMQQAEGFCREAVHLTTFRTEIWHGWVFVNLDGEAPPLATQFAGMTDDYQGVQLSFPSGVSMYGLQAGQRAQVDLERARRALEEVEEQLRLERESTELALKVNAQELVFRSNAETISAQNVASTEKAYEAGIVKASDVVNAILAKFEVQRQKLLLHMSMSEQRLINSLNRGASAKKSLEDVSRFFSE
jgi:nitrite reductase/ring-hydroxylating ferredoxin subunit